MVKSKSLLISLFVVISLVLGIAGFCLFTPISSENSLENKANAVNVVSDKYWSNISLYGINGINRDFLWTDGVDYYYSYNNTQAVLSSANDTSLSFTAMTWYGDVTSGFSGSNIFTDGTYYYMYYMSNIYSLDVSTHTWTQTTWTGNYNALSRSTVWTDGVDWYCSSNANQYKIDFANRTTTSMSWTGLTNFSGYNIFYFDGNYYYLNGATSYILNVATHTWSSFSWTGTGQLYYITGNYVWTDGTGVYVSYNSTQYVLDFSNYTIDTNYWSGLASFQAYNVVNINNVIYTMSSSSCYKLNDYTPTPTPTPTSDDWTAMTWTGTAITNGERVWTDGVDWYYSNGATQLLIDLSDYSTSTMSWTANNVDISYMSGDCIWTDGTDYYYSLWTTQAVLNVATHTWSPMTWSGLTNFSGTDIFKIGQDIYAVDSQNVGSYYKLNVATHTWSSFNFWYGQQYNSVEFTASSVWTDGVNYYAVVKGSPLTNFINGILDTNTMIWTEKTWTFDNVSSALIYGQYVWTDGVYNYYSRSSGIQYVLDLVSTIWTEKVWSPSVMTSMSGDYVWSDGVDIYYDSSTYHYVYGQSFDPSDPNYIVGYDRGYREGYSEGYSGGVQAGYNSGYSAGQTAGYNSGYSAGQTAGYNAGYNAGLESGANYSFLSLIGAVIDAPIQALFGKYVVNSDTGVGSYVGGLFSFSVFGINARDIVFGLLTISIALILVRMVLKGGK